MSGQDVLWPGVQVRLFDDLTSMHDRVGPWDLVLFTGDLTQSGRKEEFSKLNDIINELWGLFEHLGSRPRLLPVPGNHDLKRPSAEDDPVMLMRVWSCKESQGQVVKKRFFTDPKSNYRRVINNAFSEYSKWLTAQNHRLPERRLGLLPGEFSTTIEKDGANIGIIGLNTAFLQLWSEPVCDQSPQARGHLALGLEQFHAPCEGDGPAWVRKHDLCLLLTHHPPDWLNEESRTNPT